MSLKLSSECLGATTETPGSPKWGNPGPKELWIKKTAPAKRGLCSQYELQCCRALSWDGAPGRQGHRLETSATSPQDWESSLAMDTPNSHFPQPFPHTGSSQSQSPNQLRLSSIRREPQRGSRQGWLSLASPVLSKGYPKPSLRMEPHPGAATTTSHRLGRTHPAANIACASRVSAAPAPARTSRRTCW